MAAHRGGGGVGWGSAVCAPGHASQCRDIGSGRGRQGQRHRGGAIPGLGTCRDCRAADHRHLQLPPHRRAFGALSRSARDQTSAGIAYICLGSVGFTAQESASGTATGRGRNFGCGSHSHRGVFEPAGVGLKAAGLSPAHPRKIIHSLPGTCRASPPATLCSRVIRGAGAFACQIRSGWRAR